MPGSPASVLHEMFDAAVGAADPAVCVPEHLPELPRGRVVVVGAGKAAAAMARAAEKSWPRALSGLVVTRYRHAVLCEDIEVVEAAHPVPDAAGRAVAARVLEMVAGLTADDLVLCLLSGGGSALFAAPAPWLEFDEKRRITRELLRSGASIAEINCVRKHASAIKGGRLAAACHPARVVTLAISDVPGDDPSVIASGPTVPDTTTGEDAVGVLERYEVPVEADLLGHLRASETPKPGDPCLARSELVVIADSGAALAAAESCARRHGVHVVRLGDHLEGEARELAAEHAALARRIAIGGTEHPRPCVLLSGGETTVTVQGNGRGGRNSEYGLALALQLAEVPGIWAMACDTDGIDGTEDNAGCLVHPDTLARAAEFGIDPAGCLEENDSWSVFSRLGDLVITGPTLTNVNDFRAVWVS